MPTSSDTGVRLPRRPAEPPVTHTDERWSRCVSAVLSAGRGRSAGEEAGGVVAADGAQPAGAKAGPLQGLKGVWVRVRDVRKVGPEQHAVAEVAQPGQLVRGERGVALDERRERHRGVEQDAVV